MQGGEGPGRREVESAAALLSGILQPTPLVPCAAPGGEGLHLKLEVLQPTGSFKVRGVYHALARMDPARRARGVATVSAGNTAKALSWSARAFGVPARSLMPEHAPKSKIDAVRALGGTPVLVPMAEVFAHLRERRYEREPYAFVHPWIDRDVMAGHGTLALELLAQRPDVDTVYVPVGGGGLLGGVGSALKALKPGVRVVAVEPAGCPSLHAALEAGRPVEVACDTLCDGVAVPFITEEMFPLLGALADASVLVSEERVKEAIRALAQNNHVVAEGSGALAVAAALDDPRERRGVAVALVTGGSIDLPKLAAILDPGKDLSMHTRRFLTALALALAAPRAAADLKLASVFGEHAVLQRETAVAIRGWTEPAAEVAVAPGWTQAVFTGRADERGAFRIPIRTPEAGGPFALSVSSGGEEVRIDDVLIGDVWLASGQSNMFWPLVETDGGEEAVAAAAHARIRLFTVERAASVAEADDCGGAWSPCEPAAAREFSAVAYHFGRALADELGVPIGLVHASFGGTVAEAWVSAPGLRAEFPEFAEDLERIADLRKGGGEAVPASGSGDPWMHQNRPTALWNGMIAPLASFSIRGVIWYQGESNVGRHEQYRRLFPALIADWRKRFDQGDFPFYFVQLAPFDYPRDAGELALLREAQAKTELVPNTGMAVTMDVGDPMDIHPRDKRTVGLRLAALALAGAYGRAVPCHGPAFRALSFEGGTARLDFDHAQGLTSRGAPPAGFEIAGEDRVFHHAEARIEGEAILVSSRAVAEPAAVRHAWRATAASNVWNGAGLPLASFRTDAWPASRER